MWTNKQFPADLVTFTEKLLNGKLHLLYSGCSSEEYSEPSETLKLKHFAKIDNGVDRSPSCLWPVSDCYPVYVSVSGKAKPKSWKLIKNKGN